MVKQSEFTNFQKIVIKFFKKKNLLGYLIRISNAYDDLVKKNRSYRCSVILPNGFTDIEDCSSLEAYLYDIGTKRYILGERHIITSLKYYSPIILMGEFLDFTNSFQCKNEIKLMLREEKRKEQLMRRMAEEEDEREKRPFYSNRFQNQQNKYRSRSYGGR